jgi:hypothetical protein
MSKLDNYVFFFGLTMSLVQDLNLLLRFDSHGYFHDHGSILLTIYIVYYSSMWLRVSPFQSINNFKNIFNLSHWIWNLMHLVYVNITIYSRKHKTVPKYSRHAHALIDGFRSPVDKARGFTPFFISAVNL